MLVEVVTTDEPVLDTVYSRMETVCLVLNHALNIPVACDQPAYNRDECQQRDKTRDDDFCFCTHYYYSSPHTAPHAALWPTI